jgi:hypothetical protein
MLGELGLPGMATLDEGEGLIEGEGVLGDFPGRGGPVGAGATVVPTEDTTVVALTIEIMVVSPGGGAAVVSTGGITVVGPTEVTTVVSTGGGMTVVGAGEETTVVSTGGGTTVVSVA